MQNLKNEMPKLIARVDELISHSLTQKYPDTHWSTCNRAADEFDLWDDQAAFPLWLSYVVAGVMRERGID